MNLLRFLHAGDVIGDRELVLREHARNNFSAVDYVTLLTLQTTDFYADISGDTAVPRVEVHRSLWRLLLNEDGAVSFPLDLADGEEMQLIAITRSLQLC